MIYVVLSVNAIMRGIGFSFFQNPISYAMLLVLLTPLAGALALYGKGKKRLFYAAVFAVSVVALTMTYSRGAWAGFALGVFVFFLIMRPILAPVFLVAAIFALPLLPDAIFNRIMTSFNTKEYFDQQPEARIQSRLEADCPKSVFRFGTRQRHDQVGYQTLRPLSQHDALYSRAQLLPGDMGGDGRIRLLALLGTIASGMKKGLLTIFGKRGSRELQAVIAACIAALPESFCAPLWIIPGAFRASWSYSGMSSHC
jgi:hypothetical protein